MSTTSDPNQIESMAMEDAQGAFIHHPHTLRVVSEKVPWIEVGPGMSLKPLWYGSETGAWAMLARGEAGAQLPYHLHHAPGIFYTLQGQGSFPDGEFKAGDFFFEPPSVYHEATVFETESIVFFHSLGPVTFFQDDRKTPMFTHDYKMMKQLMESIK